MSNEIQFPSARKIANGEVVDELPEDAIVSFLGADFKKVTDFQAYVKGAQVQANGETKLIFGVPFEFKYDAMPVTDIRGVTFLVVVYEPVRAARREEMDDISTEGQSCTDPLAKILGWVSGDE